jgi:hypothetical protein
LNLKTKVDGLLVVWPQNHWDDFLRSGFKTSGDGFLCFDLKTAVDGYSDLTSKPVVMVSWLSLKIKAVEGFLVWASKPAAAVW